MGLDTARRLPTACPTAAIGKGQRVFGPDKRDLTSKQRGRLSVGIMDRISASRPTDDALTPVLYVGRNGLAAAIPLTTIVQGSKKF